MGLERRKAGGPLPGQELLGSTEPVLTTGPAGMPAPNLVTTDANLKQEELIPAISPHPCWFSQGQSQLSSWGHGHLGGGLGAPGPRQGQVGMGRKQRGGQQTVPWVHGVENTSLSCSRPQHLGSWS